MNTSPREQMTSPSEGGLVVRSLSKSYAGTPAVADVSLEVGVGEVVALLGENGAGKSTLSKMLTGAVQPDSGSMIWRGEPYAPIAPRDAIDVGVGMIHQEIRLLPDLSIAENVFVGRYPTTATGMVDRQTMAEKAQRHLRRLGLDVPVSTLAGDLKIAAQQLVEIGKALALDARLLILDEPTAPLGERETDLLFEQIDRLRAEGVSFIYISHRLEEIARIADRIVVMRDGRVVAAHDTADVPIKLLVEEMVGRSIESVFPELPTVLGDPVLSIRGLSGDGFNDVSFDVRSGEVFGIAGIVGAGRTELLRAIAGADTVTEGSVQVDGKPIRHDTRNAITSGIVLIPEDRKSQGVVLDQNITENITIANLDRFSVSGWLSGARVRKAVDGTMKALHIKGRPSQDVDTLSGGNQQKVVLAKWLVRDPRVVLLDEPTRGIDVGAREAIYELIVDLAAQGKAVIVVSSELEEVLGLSHRVMVMARGKQMGILEGDDRTDVEVMSLATA